MTSPKILLCDDEGELRESLADYLSARGFVVAEAADGDELARVVREEQPNLVLLDIRMSRLDGLTALRQLRGAGGFVPVIMLTAADETMDRILGLEMGADDYIGKPVDLRELEARINAVLRRRSGLSGATRSEEGGHVQIGTHLLDLAGGRLIGPDGSEIAITATEFVMLRTFAENRGRILSRDRLLDETHDRDWEPFDRSIDLRISRLRRKLAPTGPAPIRTVRGLGYVLD